MAGGVGFQFGTINFYVKNRNP